MHHGERNLSIFNRVQMPKGIDFSVEQVWRLRSRFPIAATCSTPVTSACMDLPTKWLKTRRFAMRIWHVAVHPDEMCMTSKSVAAARAYSMRESFRVRIRLQRASR